MCCQFREEVAGSWTIQESGSGCSNAVPIAKIAEEEIRTDVYLLITLKREVVS